LSTSFYYLYQSPSTLLLTQQKEIKIKETMTEITIHIKCSNSDKAEIHIDNSNTILNLKEQISDSLKVPATQQRLIYKGRVLKDDLTIASYDIQDGHTVHMVKGAAASAAATASSSSSGSTPAAASSVPPLSSSKLRLLFLFVFLTFFCFPCCSRFFLLSQVVWVLEEWAWVWEGEEWEVIRLAEELITW
jgi:uncharacterized ubiquitin-like protein YukD